MINKFLQYGLYLLLSLASSTAIASDIWVLQTSKTRQFVSINLKQNTYMVDKFSQEKGEFQDKNSTIAFTTEDKALAYIHKHYPTYSRVKNLEKWPVKKSFIDDKLFGRKNDEIWEVKNQWSEEYESRYAEWIQTEVDTDFLKKYNIATDCADVAVALRWIFARMNYLPQANTIVDTGDLFGQDSLRKKWKRLKTSEKWYNDELFLTALEYILNQTSTQTVGGDSYPLSLDQKSLIAGAFYLTSARNEGHVKVILETYYDEINNLPIYTGASTQPRALRSLAREVFNDQEWPFYTSDKEMKGFLAFRWTIASKNGWILKSKESHRNYSLEQYGPDLKTQSPSFINYLIKKLTPSLEASKLISEGLKDIQNYIGQRVIIVQKGNEFCKKNNCNEGTQEYDNWGTPSRDSKLIKKFQDMESLVKQVAEMNSTPDLINEWKEKLYSTTFQIDGYQLTLQNIYYLFSNKLTSTNPKDSLLRRWGLENDKYFSEMLEEVLKNLIEREANISRLESASSINCEPKNNCFVEYNTYHVDNALNQAYIKLKTYCSMAQGSLCNNFLPGYEARIITLNQTNKTFKEWINQIPLFNSDSRASFNARWGILETQKIPVILPFFNSITVSENNLAVLDQVKLYDLRMSKILFTAPENSRLFIEKNGTVYLIDDVNKSILKVILTDNSLSFTQMQDTDNLLSLPFEKNITSIENGDYLIFKISIKDTNILFRLSNNKVEYIDQFVKNFSQNNELITLIRDNSNISFVDLKRTAVFKFKLDESIGIGDLKKLKFSSYAYPFIFFQYHDQQSAKYFPVVLNAQTLTWKKLDMGLNDYVFMKWSDGLLKKAIIELNHFSALPQLVAISFDDQLNIITQDLLSNQLVDIQVTKDQVYFLMGTGITWESSFHIDLYKWSVNSPEKITSKENSKYKFFVNNRVYSTNEQTGFLTDLQTSDSILLPRDLLNNMEGIKLELDRSNNFSYRFSSQFGDYFLMGGNYLFTNTTNIPDYTTYSWFDSKNADDLSWASSFSQQNIQNGNLRSFGRNFAIWWK